MIPYSVATNLSSLKGVSVRGVQVRAPARRLNEPRDCRHHQPRREGRDSAHRHPGRRCCTGCRRRRYDAPAVHDQRLAVRDQHAGTCGLCYYLTGPSAGSPPKRDWLLKDHTNAARIL
jgi:hypothetical protein